MSSGSLSDSTNKCLSGNVRASASISSFLEPYQKRKENGTINDCRPTCTTFRMPWPDYANCHSLGSHTRLTLADSEYVLLKGEGGEGSRWRLEGLHQNLPARTTSCRKPLSLAELVFVVE
ncbi:unnamed protein product [Protopolystoma xenopodis]|uniref:Uncharacterized protein n=1 Tax=Protopolystoma xenopodis TaxID=117903 RepID=A0A3S5B3F2_9PLAT|nr:unnamed protein product [Protopolystoma xenopodis]